MPKPLAVGLMLTLGGGAVGVSSQEPAATPVASRVILENITVRGPLGRCAVAALVLSMGNAVAAPTGIEYLPGPCVAENEERIPLTEPLSFLGATLGDALNQLVRLDPRYGWKDAGGVIVVRPMAAWLDGRHFLHREMASFEVVDQHMGAALDGIGDAIWRRQGPSTGEWGMRTEQSARRFTVQIGDVQILDALNAAAREHGAMQWFIRYCQPYAREEFASLHFTTFDHDGIGRGGHFAPGPDGKMRNLCPGQP